VPRKTSLLSLPADKPRISRAIAFLLGCLTTTAFAPFGWYALLPVTLLPFFYVCLTVSPRDAGRHGFWFGFGLFLTGTYWIYISVVVFGQAPVWIALMLMIGLVLIMSAWLWFTAWLVSRLANGKPLRLLAVAPAAWVLVEWLRGWVLTGFPWLALGYSQIASPLSGWAPVIGVYGVSLLLVLSIAALLAGVALPNRARPILFGVVVLPWLAGSLLKAVEWTEPRGEALTATLIQGGIPQDRKWLPEQFWPTLNFYRSRTLEAARSDIVLWPEVAIPSVTDLVEDYISMLEQDAKQARQTLLFGILERASDPAGSSRTYNAVIAVGSDPRAGYRKRHLVPFGEYFPVPPQVREWMRMLSLPHRDLAAGSDEQPLIRTRDGLELAVAICYEDAYGAEQLYALPAASLLINVSNDAWFGDSIAPHQHLQIARMRSLEFGRATLRAANTGISAFIDHEGQIVDAGPQFQPVVLTQRIQPRHGATPYVRVGNTPIIALCALILAGFWLRSRPS
jgi:apolipoprotein N-acyltransferase